MIVCFAKKKVFHHFCRYGASSLAEVDGPVEGVLRVEGEGEEEASPARGVWSCWSCGEAVLRPPPSQFRVCLALS